MCEEVLQMSVQETTQWKSWTEELNTQKFKWPNIYNKVHSLISNQGNAKETPHEIPLQYTAD